MRANYRTANPEALAALEEADDRRRRRRVPLDARLPATRRVTDRGPGELPGQGGYLGVGSPAPTSGTPQTG